MAHETSHKIIALPPRQPSAGKGSFPGFAAPTSNTTYTPNQFFDVVMPNASRGCLRIVAYLIRKTLGWCDALGNPQHEKIEVAYGEMVRRAGVSRDMIREALNEATASHYIECVRQGRASSAGDFGASALYSLKWDATPHYARQLAEFKGFYEGEGHRTDIPNELFDLLIPAENLSVIKVVGSVIRYSIGFQAKHGRRRQQATLAYSQILKVSGMSSRRSLAAAIREAVSRKYIVRLDSGYFSATISERRSATYAVRWSDDFQAEVTSDSGPTSQKRIPAEVWINQSEKDTSDPPDQSDLETSTSQKRIPADQSEKDTIETKQLNEKEKQQRYAADLLRKEGFDPKTAEQISARHSPDEIKRQIDWLPRRQVTRSRVGLLRRAIEGVWQEPGTRTIQQQQQEIRHLSEGTAADYQPLRPDYLEWLRRQEAECRQNHSSEYARFLAKRVRRRRDLQAENSWMLRDFFLSQHDSENRRLLDFQRFMSLPDFQNWQAQFNHLQTTLNP